MRIIYYVLPTDQGSDICLTENLIYRESELALLIEAGDEKYPWYDIVLQENQINYDLLDYGEPILDATDEDFIRLVAPIKDASAISTIMKNIKQKLLELRDWQEEDDIKLDS